MGEIRLTYQELTYYMTAVNILLGVLFGSLPLIAGFVLKNRKYGWLGFLLSIVGGAVLGIFLSYPLALIFTILIARGLNKSETLVSDPERLNNS